MRQPLARVLLAASIALACDGNLRLVLVEPGERGGAAGLGGGGAAAGAGGTTPNGAASTDSGGSSPAAGSQSSSGQGGISGNGGAATSGRAGEEAEAGAAGMPATAPWDAPTQYVASYASLSHPGQYMRHVETLGFVGAVDLAVEVDKRDASFEVIPGVYDATCVSLRAIDKIGTLFRHANSRVYMAPAENEPLYLADATFCPEPGLGDPEGVTFRSSNYPTRVIHLRNQNELWIDEVADTSEFAADATFYREGPLLERE